MTRASKCRNKNPQTDQVTKRDSKLALDPRRRTTRETVWVPRRRSPTKGQYPPLKARKNNLPRRPPSSPISRTTIDPLQWIIWNPRWSTRTATTSCPWPTKTACPLLTEPPETSTQPKLPVSRSSPSSTTTKSISLFRRTCLSLNSTPSTPGLKEIKAQTKASPQLNNRTTWRC